MSTSQQAVDQLGGTNAHLIDVRIGGAATTDATPGALRNLRRLNG